MQDDDKPILIYATYPDLATAEQEASTLVSFKLAACVNIIPAMTSIYRWEGKIERGSEVVAIIKTRASLASRAIEEARARHPYTNPAFLVIPVLSGSADYIDWLMGETAEQHASGR